MIKLTNKKTRTQKTSKKANQLQQGEVLIGYIQGITEQTQAEVSFQVDQVIHVYPALTTIPISMGLMGRNVVLSFVEGNLSQPIIMGLLWQAENKTPKKDLEYLEKEKSENLENFKIIKAEDRIELQCGQASITLTHTGKIMLRGQMITSHAAGTHRIKGGTIQIN